MATTKLLLAGQRICLHSPRKLEAAIWLLCLSRKMTKEYFSARNQKLASEKFASEISHMISRTLTLDNENLTFAIWNSTSLGETRPYVNAQQFLLINSVYKSFDIFGSMTAFHILMQKRRIQRKASSVQQIRTVAAFLNHDGLLETTTKVCMNPL